MVPVLVGLAACAQSGPPVAVERVVVGADESQLVFTDIQDPPLRGTYYRLDTSDRKTTGVLGVWSGRRKYPHARMIYTALAPGYCYTGDRDADKYLDGLNLGKAAKIVRGDSGHRVNALGRVGYRRFTAEGSECVAFSQQFGSASCLRNTGSQRVFGHYCQAPGTRMDDTAIAAILDGIGIRGIAVPEGVAGQQAAITPHPYEIPITGTWDNHFDSVSGILTASDIRKARGKIHLALPGTKGECVGQWKVATDKPSDDGRIQGDWSAVCTNGLAAKGTYRFGEDGGAGEGKDQDGNAVRFTIAKP